MMDSITEYMRIVDSIYGTYFDSTNGFSHNRKQMKMQQSIFIKENSIKNPSIANKDYINNCKVIYGKGDPNNPKSFPLHICTQKEYIDRNSENGKNYEFAGNMTVISLYHYWEENYRDEITKSLELQEKIKIPVFGDLRILRNSIVHHRGIVKPQMKKEFPKFN